MPANAAHAEERFCIQPLKIHEPLGAPQSWRLMRIIETTKPENDIFFFRGESDPPPLRLIENTFLPTSGNFPIRPVYDTIITTPYGDVIGINDHSNDGAIYKQNRTSGRFEKMLIDSDFDLKYIRDIGWSTPLNAILLTIGGNDQSPNLVLVLKDNIATPLKGVDEWITHINDFPEINLTLLVSEVNDTIYIVDGEKQLHNLASLDIGDWIFISRSALLEDPARILLVASEAMGPFRGLYLIQLEERSGTWGPTQKQDWTNLMKGVPTQNAEGQYNGRRVFDKEHGRYFFYGQLHSRFGWSVRRLFRRTQDSFVGLYQVGATRLERVDETDPIFFENLPKDIKIAIDDSYLHKFYGDEKKIVMSKSNAVAILTDISIRIVDAEGRSHVLDQSVLGQGKLGLHIQTNYLPHRGEVLFASNDNLALIKDRQIAGPEACSE